MKNIALALAAALLFTASPASAQMHAPTPMTLSQFRNAATGSTVELVVRVTEYRRATIAGTFLSRVDDSKYAATNVSVQLYAGDDTPVMMGSMSDVRPGAILYVTATATAHDRADVKRIVVVTPYVTVS